MRTTQELHIALDLLLQKTSSHWNKNFLPQEKDWFLNQEIIKFIKQRLNPLSNDKRLSMYDTLKRIGDLNSLVKTVIIEGAQLTDSINVPLPVDNLYYISSVADVTCNSKPETMVTTSRRFPSFTNTSSITSSAIIITVPSLGTVTVFSSADLPAQYLPQDNIPSYKKDFIYNNAILSIVNKNLDILFGTNSISGNDFTQEPPKLKSLVSFTYNKRTNTFEFTGNLSSVSVVINGTGQNVQSNTISYTANTSTTGIKKASVRIIDEEFKTEVETSYLSCPTEASICAYLRLTMLQLPKVPSVIVNALKVTYVAEPRKIDLLLGINSELPDEILDEIVAKTGETMQGIIGADTYEKYVRENMLIE